ncbi:MAG: cytochrome c3 family protein [Pirellulales bacterium]|nr:cytochrome c3 family protein [Pirellulales bacterium]
MRHSVWVVLASLSLAAVVYTADLLDGPGLSPTGLARAAEEDLGNSGGPPPLVIDKGAPLLLGDAPEEDPFAVPSGPVADNLACHCCHMNYEEEPFAVAHAKTNVGCVKCHGQSYAHRDDEDNITPPEVMFPPDKIEANCQTCHDTHDAPAAKVIALWKERCPEKANPEDLLCTDCHGEHRLKIRTVRWNKETRELIIRKVGEEADTVSRPPAKEPAKTAMNEPGK